jgi:phenylpyruvate tautomerase PptA (4-oxalocrotonate tautomerase family)
MPLHRLYVPPHLYSVDDKAAISAAITNVYSKTLPEFYVVVLFINVDKDDFYVGGKRSDTFLRISVQHIARQMAEQVVLHCRIIHNRVMLKLFPLTVIKRKGNSWMCTRKHSSHLQRVVA